MSKGEAHKEWRKENQIRVTFYLNKQYDADIIQATSRAEREGEPRATAYKRWIRMGIQSEYSR